jgi:hypothetical protein
MTGFGFVSDFRYDSRILAFGISIPEQPWLSRTRKDGRRRPFPILT